MLSQLSLFPDPPEPQYILEHTAPARVLPRGTPPGQRAFVRNFNGASFTFCSFADLALACPLSFWEAFAQLDTGYFRLVAVDQEHNARAMAQGESATYGPRPVPSHFAA